jgi:hypothetical protein
VRNHSPLAWIDEQDMALTLLSARAAGPGDTQASTLATMDCALTIWRAEWLDGGFATPMPISSDIYSTEPDALISSCEESAGEIYDKYFPACKSSHATVQADR